MVIEAALIKPVVDALMGLFRQGDNLRLKRNAEAALREAIRELLLASPDDNKAEARIAIAKAAGILSEDVVLAEKMLTTHRATKTRTSGKAATGRKRKPGAEPAAPADKAASGRAMAKPAAATSDPPADGKPTRPATKSPAKRAVKKTGAA